MAQSFAFNHYPIYKMRSSRSMHRKLDLILMRVFGGANLILVALGAYLWVGTAGGALSQFRRSTNDAPYAAYMYWVMSVISLVLLALLVVAGIGLLQLKVKSAKICAITLASEIAYFVIFVILQFVFAGAGHEPIYRSLLAVSGIGQMALSPQLATLYPLIGLIFMLVLTRRSRFQGGQ